VATQPPSLREFSSGRKLVARDGGLPSFGSTEPAKQVTEFLLRYLRHVKGEHAGRPFMLERWQESEIIRPLFGTMVEGRRQYRTCYVTMPRKGGKSTLAAAIALYLLYADGEIGADIVSAAADREQAAVVFNIAREMVEQSPELKAMTAIYRRELVVPSTGSRYKVISSEAYSKHGMNLHGCVIDELHAHENRELFEVLRTSTGARRQPLMFIITTAGVDEHSIAAEVHHYAEQVRDGVIEEPSFLPIIYGAAPEADIWDEAVWRACNPALQSGFRSLDEMRVAARQAKAIPEQERAFRQLYLNQWGTAAAERWLSLAEWDACRVEAVPMIPGQRAYIGVDLSSRIDLSALVLLLPDGDGGYGIKAEFWCPGEHIGQRTHRDRVPYETWARHGYLTATPGNTIDYSFIEARIHALMTEYDVAVVAIDPWNARDFTPRLKLNMVPVIEIPQTMANLTTASKALEVLILERRLHHDGHPIMRWCVSNAVADIDGNDNRKPSKHPKRSYGRIDGVSALVTALAQAVVHPPDVNAEAIII
jgi:phage terminase large subunit-like protein